MSDLPPSKDNTKPANQPAKTLPNDRQLRPEDIPIYNPFYPSPWKRDIISLGRYYGDSVYRFLIIHDVERARKLLPFSFIPESYLGYEVIRVNKYREELEKHGPGLGLKLSTLPCWFFRDELVISDVERPAYDYPHENGVDDSPPPPYDFKNVPGELSASKPDAKKI